MESPTSQIDDLPTNEMGDSNMQGIDSEINKDPSTNDTSSEKQDNNDFVADDDADAIALVDAIVDEDEVEMEEQLGLDHDDETGEGETTEANLHGDTSEDFNTGNLLGIHADTDDEAMEPNDIASDSVNDAKVDMQELNLETPVPGATLPKPLTEEATPEEKRLRLARNNMISRVQFRRDQNNDRKTKSLTVSPVPVEQLLSEPFYTIMRECYKFSLNGENKVADQMGFGTMDLYFHTVKARDDAEITLKQWKGEDENKTIEIPDIKVDGKKRDSTNVIQSLINPNCEIDENDDLQNLVFVKNIPEDAEESKLIEMLPGAIHVIFGHKPDNTRRNYAFLIYGTKEEAAEATSVFNESPTQYVPGTDLIVAKYCEFAYEVPSTVVLADGMRQKLLYKFVDLKKLHSQLLSTGDFDKMQAITLQVEVVGNAIKNDADLRTAAGLPAMNVNTQYNRRGGRGGAGGDYRGNWRNNNNMGQNNRGMHNRSNSNGRGGFQPQRGQGFNRGVSYQQGYGQTQNYYANNGHQQQQNYYGSPNRGYQNNQGMNRGQKRRGPSTPNNISNNFRGKRGRF